MVACALRLTREANAARRAIPECCLLFAAVPASPRDGGFYFGGRDGPVRVTREIAFAVQRRFCARTLRQALSSVSVAQLPGPPPYAFGFGWQAAPMSLHPVRRPAARSPSGVGVSPEAPLGAKGDGHSMWYVYFLRLRDGSIYVGSTNNLRYRYDSHPRGQVISTKRYLPVTLESYIAVPSERNARQLERWAAELGERKLDARSRRLLGLEKNELVLVRDDHFWRAGLVQTVTNVGGH